MENGHSISVGHVIMRGRRLMPFHCRGATVRRIVVLIIHSGGSDRSRDVVIAVRRAHKVESVPAIGGTVDRRVQHINWYRHSWDKRKRDGKYHARCVKR